MKIPLLDSYFNSFGYIPGRGMVRLYSSSIFYFYFLRAREERELHTVFQNSIRYTIPINNIQGFNFSKTSPTLIAVAYFTRITPTGVR